MTNWFATTSRVSLATCLLLTARAAGAQNLISDPHFASGVSSWALRLGGIVTASLTHDPGPGADGTSGFATLTGGSFGITKYFARTCVPIQPGVVYSWGGRVRFRSVQQSLAWFSLNYHTDADCGTIFHPPQGFASPGACGARE